MFNALLRHDMPEGTECSTIPAAASAYRSNLLEHVLEIEEEFAFRVLGDGGGYRVRGKIVQLAGRRLIAQVSECLSPETCLRIDLKDAFVLGEVIGCWHEGPTTFVALELHQVLNGLKCWAPVQRLETVVRLRA